MTQTDILKIALENFIELHRESIDRMGGLTQVQILVSYDARTGHPGKITLRPELVTLKADK